jgi:hypothetical protein
MLWVSIGWSENESALERTEKYTAIAVLIPLPLWFGIRPFMQEDSDTRSLGLSENDSQEKNQESQDNG